MRNVKKKNKIKKSPQLELSKNIENVSPLLASSVTLQKKKKQNKTKNIGNVIYSS